MSETATSDHDDWCRDALGIDPAQYSSGASSAGSAASADSGQESGGVFGALSDAASVAANVAGDVGSGAVQASGNVVQTVGDAAGAAANIAGDVASGALRAADDVVQSVGDTADVAANVVGDLASGAVQAGGDLVETVGHAVGAAANVAGDVASGALQAAGDVVQSVGDAAGAAANVAGDLASGAVQAGGDVVETVGHAVGAAANVAGDVASGALQAAGDVVQSVDDAAGAAANVAGDLASGAVQAVGHLGQAAASAGNVVEGADQSTSGDGSSDSPRLNKFLKDAGWLVAGAGVHAIAGAVPLGVVGSTAIDVAVAAKADPEQKYWYGLGSTAAGVFDFAAGAAEVAGGLLGALPTGGLSLAVSAEGVNEMVAGAEAVTAGTMLMSQGNPGGGGGSGGSGGDSPSFEAPITDLGNQVAKAESLVGELEQALADETSTVEDGEAIMDALEAQKRAGKFDPEIGALEGKVQKDIDLLRRSGTDTKEAQGLQNQIDQMESRRQSLATEIEQAADVDRTLSTEKADRLSRALSGLSQRLSTLSARLETAKDGAIEMQARAQKLAERLKQL